MNIIQRFIPASNKDTRPGIKMTPKYITIHETDNPDAGANANAHARLQERGNDRSASWHLQIDDQQAIQSIPFNEIAWAAGDGRNGSGNKLSIHIEICVNSDGDFRKAVQNTAEVTKQLMGQFNISISNVVQHNHWTGKNCPRNLRSGEKGITWNDFIGLVNGSQPPAAVFSQLLGETVAPYVPTDNGIIGKVKVIVDGLNIRQAPDLRAAVTRKALKGEIFDVYANVNDWHNVGGANWIFGNNGQYLSLIRN
ncbi:N-acetylmuramoyl-L-alanine amidase [Neobacillus bataviensis LMG 21833]|uniref:N-acetylmuramoyl-L-alanine amidase n=1 Tax=Neobacillus bataviensis LMG 21833 TaxID=1117379 RepID=K6DT48_9BACI|nr:N-acetylmuramoyl-L-alanine amidase [Neobacillus bataviensis]EKN71504.1 N-acetylmuramoyl-L-alanine amidase [Neobacillus bataviensis LMG 21833]